MLYFSKTTMRYAKRFHTTFYRLRSNQLDQFKPLSSFPLTEIASISSLAEARIVANAELNVQVCGETKISRQ